MIFGIAMAGGCNSNKAGFETVPATHGSDFYNLLDAVVRIDVREAFFEQGARRLQRGVGSGVLMTEDGYLLTNAHVVSPRAEEIVVTLSSLEKVDAVLVGWDHWTDLALLKLDMDSVQRRGLKFKHAQFGDSTQLQPGQTVYAVGTPNGLTRTVTRGIISNTQRYFAESNQIGGYETGYFNTWLQTDAAINPGNSGGPLVTENGRVIGINTRSYLGANNLSFAVPSVTAIEVMDQLLETGSVTRSSVGFRLSPMQDLEDYFGINANLGALVDSVDPGSPANRAGLRAGDVILSINSIPVDGRFPEQLPGIMHQIASLPVTEELTLVVRRGSSELPISIVTERLESRMGEQDSLPLWGMSVQNMSSTLSREMQLDSAQGVVVIGLQSAFPAEKAGLSRGDVIISVNRRPVNNLDDMRALYTDLAQSSDRVLVEVKRFRQISLLVMRP